MEEQQETRTMVIMGTLKDQVVTYQERRGIPRTPYTYSNVVWAILSLAWQAIRQVFLLMLALAPVSEVAIHLARFSLERSLDIAYTTERHEVLFKMVLFGVQFTSLLFLVTFVFGTILVPVYMMGLVIVSKLTIVLPG